MEEFEKSLKDLSEEELVGILDKNEFAVEDEFEILIKEMEARGISGRIIQVDGSPDDEQGKQLLEYIQYHEKLPHFQNESEEDKAIKKAIRTLKEKDHKLLSDQKMAIIILAH